MKAVTNFIFRARSSVSRAGERRSARKVGPYRANQFAILGGAGTERSTTRMDYYQSLAARAMTRSGMSLAQAGVTPDTWDP
jgi:hypothetical protein